MCLIPFSSGFTLMVSCFYFNTCRILKYLSLPIYVDIRQPYIQELSRIDILPRGACSQ